MLRFIWQNWWRRKERFILLLIGALIISVGLTYLVGLSETNEATVVDELQQRWSSSYDIVVRSEGTRSSIENEKLLDPNFLSGIYGGIRMSEYEAIKEIADVDIAAPIAMIGSFSIGIIIDSLEFPEPGFYKITEKIMTNDSSRDIVHSSSNFTVQGDWNIFEDIIRPLYQADDHLTPISNSQSVEHTFVLRKHIPIAAIDPEQENRLVGLEDTMIPIGDSRYFTEDDTSRYEIVADETIDNEKSIVSSTSFPVIMSTQTQTNMISEFSLQRVDLQFNEDIAEETFAMIAEKSNFDETGDFNFLDEMDLEEGETISISDEEIVQRLVNSVSGIDHDTGEGYFAADLEQSMNDHYGLFLDYRPTPLKYAEVESPFPNRWPYAYALHAIEDDQGYESFRKWEIALGEDDEQRKIIPRWIGSFDPTLLDISQDPLNELPMETYRPAHAELVLDGSTQPVNPPKQLTPPNNTITTSENFLEHPPMMLTTLDAAMDLALDDQPISAIRIKVDGVDDLSEESQEKVEQVAEEIERETALITDITLGSSPQPTLVHVPAINETEELGWVEQPWINIGASISIFRETKLGFSGLVLSVMAVAVIYVWASSLVSLLARRKEFAVLLSVGWRPSQLGRLLFTESIILGLLVAIVAWMMLGFVYVTEGATVDPVRFVFTGLFGLMVYLLGAIIPALIARNIRPYEAMRTGEISKTSNRLMPTKGIFSMALNHFIGKWKRSLLSVIAIALPTSLLAVFLFITFYLQGVMFTTWLGEYVALEVGPIHYTAIIVALAIAILTTAEMMWQNIAERQEEIALLKAVGWKNIHVRIFIWLEGLFSGWIAAVIGLSLAFLMMWALYQEIPTEHLPFILSTAGIPLVIGVLGTVLPAERAVRISPVQGMGGREGNRKIVEQIMKWGLLTLFILLMGAFIFMMIQMVLVM